MKKVIVSGANGFVGAAVVGELLKNNIEVIALINGNNDSNLPNHKKLRKQSFSLSKAHLLVDVIEDRDIDTFFHMAWMGSAGKERADYTLQLNNAKWTLDCMNVAKKLGCSRFIEAGSIMELETMKATYKDGNRPGMGYIYGSGKLAAHTMGKAYAANLGIDLVWAMITNAYGVGEKSPRMVNTTIQKCIQGISPQFTAGTQNYDFVYIDDVARAFRLIGENGKPFNEYLIGSSNAKPLKEFLLEMKAAIAPDIDFIFGDIPFTGVNQPLEEFDCSKTERDTGFRAEISFAEGCRMTRDWWLSL